jgi:hypothetical protein
MIKQSQQYQWLEILPRNPEESGIFHMAEYSLLLGVKLKDVPPGIGTLREILAKYGLAAHS